MSPLSEAPVNPSSAVPRVVLYSKPNCPLCDKALEQIEIARTHARFDFTETNILAEPELYERYKTLIPVVTVEGSEVARYRIRWEDLVARLQECLEDR